MSKTETYRAVLAEGLKSLVLEMLSMMAMVEVACTGSKEIETFSVTGPATGLMVMVGEYRTIVALCMPEPLLRGFIAGITGNDPDTLAKQDLRDGIGEMVSMICGGIKTKLTGADIELLPPMTILGSGYNAEWNTDQKAISPSP